MTVQNMDIPSSAAVVSTVFDGERERMHRQMLSSVSHDLKTPLASIIGALEIFERMHDKLPEDKKLSLINVALQEAYRLDTFVTNILDMARLENGQVKANFEGAEINSVIRTSLTRMDSRLHHSTVDFETIESIRGITDPILLGRAVSLILDNAVKYGGMPSTIHIACGKDARGFGFIEIRDNGQGIPATQTEIIFSKYTRLEKGDQQNAGTGLGLAISRAILELLHGDITASNAPQGGAIFTMRFPLQERRKF